MSEIIGRDEALANVLDVVLGAGRERAAVIEGAPGIGKTVLLDAAIDESRRQGHLVLVSRPAEADRRIALLGLHDLLAPVAADALRVLPGPQRERLEAALSRDSPLPDHNVAEPQLGLAVAIVNALRGLAQRRRLVVAIDDVQWLDRSSSSLLDVALRRLFDDEVRFVSTRRSGTRNVGYGLALARIYGDRLRTIGLDGLALGALQRLIAIRLARSLPRPALLRLHAATGGNPFYAIELARALGDAESPGAAFDTAPPPDVWALLAHRIGGLPRVARDVLGLVALTTRPSIALLADTLERPLQDIEAAVDAALETGLLVEEPAGLALAHPLIGSAARTRIPPERRRRLHRRLASIVADPDQAAVYLSLSATGPDEPVAAALETAARRGIARGATIDAVDLLGRAIQLTPPARQDALVLRRMALARALLLAGDTRRSMAELESLDIGAIPDLATRAEATLLLGIVERYAGVLDAAIRRLEDALEWVPDTSARARINLRLAVLLERDRRAALDHAEQALALLDPAAAPRDYAFALLMRAGLELALGIRADHDAVARGAALQSGAGSWNWDVSLVPANWPVWMDQWDAARNALRMALQEAAASGDETSVGHLERRLVEVETWAGNLALAADLVERAVEQAESAQQLPAVASSLARRALVRALVGEVDGADLDGRRALAIAETFGSPVIVAYALTALGAVARARDDFVTVDELLTRATSMLDATGDVDHSAYRFHADHLDALVALGDFDRARALIDRLDRRAALGPRPVWAGVAERGRAALALAEGRPDEASEHADRALAIHEGMTVPFETARTLLLVAEVERRSRRRKAAAARLEEAIAILDRIGARGLADKARAELAPMRIGLRDLVELTPSEERMAGLAADGLRNREIAQRLHVSPKTVEAALARAYDKLGIRSRAQLSAALAAKDEGGAAHA